MRLDERTARELTELAERYRSRSAAVQDAIHQAWGELQTERLEAGYAVLRLTTTARELPTWVKLSSSDPLTGYANADCIEQLGKDKLGEYLGALSAASMCDINRALAVALALG